MSTTTKIDSYEVMYSSNAFAPRIWLRNSGRYIGQLIFNANGTNLPLDSVSNGQITLYYHLEDFKNIINLLRNERSVYLLFAGSGPGFENGIKKAIEAEA